MLRQWTAVYHYEWTPIITFARRRVELLDWLEDHTAPVAFTASGDHVGVAYVAEDMRIVVHPKGMMISTGFSRVPLETIEDPVRGIFDVMTPRSALLAHFQVLSTADLGETDYHEARAAFARRTSFGISEGSPYRPTDSSALVDIEASDVRFQIEWGLVDHEEILTRLTEPEMGRIGGSRQGMKIDSPEYDEAVDEAPEVAALVDVQGWTKTGGTVTDSATVLERAAEADAHAARLASHLYDSVINDKEN